MSEWLLFNSNEHFQLSWQEQVTFQWHDDVHIVWLDISLHSDTLSWFWANQSWCLLNREAANTNYIVFGMTQPGLKPMIYHTRGEHVNHYIISVVVWVGVDVHVGTFKKEISAIQIIYLVMLNDSCSKNNK